MKRCKICGSLSQDYAQKCSFCNSDFALEQSAPLKHDPTRDAAKTPMEGIVVILLLLAISFLPTIPVALVVSTYLEPEITLLICWAVVFIVSLIVYRIAVSNTRTAQRYNECFHMKDDAVDEYEETTEAASPAQDKEQNFSYESYMPDQFSNSAFCVSLSDACRNVAYPDTPVYDAEMNCETASAYLAGLSSKQARRFDTATARTLLAAMAARRMILLCGNDNAELERAVANVAQLTGEKATTLKIGRNCATPTELYIAEGTAYAPLPSVFLRELFLARMRQNAICPFLLDAEAPNKLGTAMADLKPYLENGMIESKITVENANRSYGNFAMDESVVLPANTRLFFAYRPGSSTPMPRNMMDVCAFVNLKDTLSEGETLNAVLGALSFDRLLRLCDDAEERFALSEENWKKIDDLTEKLTSACGFAPDNKLITAMERFVGVYMAAGGSEQEALDSVLACVLLPAALTLLSTNTSEDSPALSQLLDAGFGMENLPACAEMLKKFSAA